MMPARIVWTGDEKLERMLRELPGKAVKVMADALWLEGELIMTRSKDDFVPVDVGTLKGSGFVEDPDISGNRVSVTMGYGGPASDYALIQHENMDYNHPGQGGPKYLERPANEARRGLGERLARRMRRRLET